jgi:hypothetical protein
MVWGRSCGHGPAEAATLQQPASWTRVLNAMPLQGSPSVDRMQGRVSHARRVQGISRRGGPAVGGVCGGGGGQGQGGFGNWLSSTKVCPPSATTTESARSLAKPPHTTTYTPQADAVDEFYDINGDRVI